jgi:uncharacterized protein (DUF433 family)
MNSVENILEAIKDGETEELLHDSGFNQKFIELTLKEIKQAVSDIKVLRRS